MKVFGLIFILSLNSWAFGPDKVGQKQDYALNNSRSTWMIKDAQGSATLLDFKIDEVFGPSYTLNIDYQFSVRMYGKEKGSIKLLIPEYMLREDFAERLGKSQSINLNKYIVDYKGMDVARDCNGAQYDQCLVARIHHLSADLWPKGNNPISSFITNVELNLRIKPSIKVIGAVQIDIKANLAGIPVKVGFDVIL